MSESSSTTTQRNILVSGLGGGLDIHNALLMYLLLKNGKDQASKLSDDFKYKFDNIYLGSIRPCGQEDIENPIDTSLSPSVTIIGGESKITIKGRYFEPTISKELNQPVIMMTGSRDKTVNIDTLAIENLTLGLKALVEKYSLTDIIVVDGGGDSLILSGGDSIDKIHGNVFIGGDAVVLASLHKLSAQLPELNVIQAIISVGLDVNRKAFKKNIKEIGELGGYYGRINFATGKTNGTRNHTNIFTNSLTRYVFGNDLIRELTVQQFFELSEKYLVLTVEHSKQSNDTSSEAAVKRFMSHTAVVTYHALKNNLGLQRTFVPWEPKLKEGKGVIVDIDHQWMYLVNPATAEQIKIEKNKPLGE